VEALSEHPLARAVVDGARRRDIEPVKVEDFGSVPGSGVQGTVDGHRVRVGRERFLGVPVRRELAEAAGAMEAEGKTPVWVAIDDRAVAVLGIADEIKPTSPEAIRRLKELGLETIMLTGDREATAQAIAERVGVDRVVAEVLPEQKVDEIRRLQSEGKRVAMVGDGVNDAPALAQADLGIAIGTGSDVAIEASDITLVGGDPTLAAKAIELSRRTLRAIKQNLFWAFFYNVIAIPLAVIGLLEPMIAAAAMAFSSVSVVLNALRLRRAV
jgi:P-type Cu+ transporter